MMGTETSTKRAGISRGRFNTRRDVGSRVTVSTGEPLVILFEDDRSIRFRKQEDPETASPITLKKIGPLSQLIEKIAVLEKGFRTKRTHSGSTELIKKGSTIRIIKEDAFMVAILKQDDPITAEPIILLKKEKAYKALNYNV